MKWIKSSEQLPPKDTLILFYIESLMYIGSWNNNIQKYTDTAWCRYNIELDEKEFKNMVNYWCELPEKPDGI